MSDLLSGAQTNAKEYDASSIQVLEDMEHVRLRPGMYIGGKDDRALHHMVAEIIDNSMDEAVAGHATWIELELHENGHVTVRDNGRGIPTDPHPKDPSKSALEIIFCTLNAGGKFSGDSYETSGGLHGVGSSVVNALSDHLRVEVARNRELFAMEFSRGIPQGKLEKIGAAPNRRGTAVTFHPDPDIFGALKLKPARLFAMARSKAYLFSGVEIRWKTAQTDGDTPQEATFHFPGGLSDYLNETLKGSTTYAEHPFGGTVDFREKFNAPGKVEWSINWTPSRDGFIQSYCNTIPTPEGGTHEAGFWAAILKGIKAYGELVGTRTVYNDRLLMFMLRNRAPQRFAEGQAKALNAIGTMEMKRLKKKWRKEWEAERASVSPAEVRASIERKVQSLRQQVDARQTAEWECLSEETRQAITRADELKARDLAKAGLGEVVDMGGLEER